jgi:hypothetical protein
MKRPKVKRRIVLGTGWLWNPEHFHKEHHAKPVAHGTVIDVFLSRVETMMQQRRCRVVLEVLPEPRKKRGGR